MSAPGPERLESLQSLREALAVLGDASVQGWLVAFLIIFGALFLLASLLSSLALPLVLLRLHTRLKQVESRLDAISARLTAEQPPPGD